MSLREVVVSKRIRISEIIESIQKIKTIRKLNSGKYFTDVKTETNLYYSRKNQQSFI